MCTAKTTPEHLRHSKANAFRNKGMRARDEAKQPFISAQAAPTRAIHAASRPVAAAGRAPAAAHGPSHVTHRRVNTQRAAQLVHASHMHPPSHESQVLPAEESAGFGVGRETGGDGVVGHACNIVE
jgi:hypothetical protein